MKKTTKKNKLLSAQDVLKRVSDNKKTVYIPELEGSIDIKLMSWAEMVSLKKSDASEEEQECILISSALGLSREEALKMRNGNGTLYAAILCAINDVYSIGEKDVKKQ